MFNLRNIYKKRDPWAHKGQFGKLLIVAGSNDFTGSPIYNGVSALRAGADLVYIVTPLRVSNIVGSYLPELINVPYFGDFLTTGQVPLVLKIAEERRTTALLIGGGLGRGDKTKKAILEIIKKIDLPSVIDADAIRALENHWQILKNKKAILTPHGDEFRQLTGEEVSINLEDRKKKVKKWAEILEAVILLKGHIDVISDGKEIYLGHGGSPYMTVGGFGDTLAGICGALLARGVLPFEAACAASYINKKAGELACQKYGEGVIASDIFYFIPEVIK